MDMVAMRGSAFWSYAHTNTHAHNISTRHTHKTCMRYNIYNTIHTQSILTRSNMIAATTNSHTYIHTYTHIHTHTHTEVGDNDVAPTVQ